MAADDIMAFMTRVKRKLVDDDAQYATFVRALHRWEQQAIGTDELEASVTSLLADDEGLLRDFARLFAPRAPGGAARAAAAPADVDAAVAYLRDVEARVGDEARYGEFLALLRLWEAGRVEIDALVRDVSRLLGGDAALLARFNMFAPPGHAIFPEADAAPPPAPPPPWAEAAGDVAIALTRREARRGTRARRARGLRVALGRASLGAPSTRGRFLRNARGDARRPPRRRGRAPRARAHGRVRGDAAPRGGARARRRRRLRRREPRDAGLPRPRRRALRGVAGRRADADPFYPTSTRAYANGFDARLAAALRELDERRRFVPKSAESTRPRVPQFGGDPPTVGVRAGRSPPRSRTRPSPSTRSRPRRSGRSTRSSRGPRAARTSGSASSATRRAPARDTSDATFASTWRVPRASVPERGSARRARAERSSLVRE